MAWMHKATARVSSWYKSMSIQMVISLSFTFVAVVGTMCMAVGLFWRFSADTRRAEIESTQSVISQVNFNMDSYLRQMMRISDTIYYRIIKDNNADAAAFDSGMRLIYEENRESLMSLALFDSSGALVHGVPYNNLKSSVSPQQCLWFTAALERSENMHFFTPQVQNLFVDPDYSYRWVVSLSRYVELTRNGNIESGVLLVDMNFSKIEQICRNAEFSNGGYLYLIDGNGELIYHPKQQLIYANIMEENNMVAASYRDGSYSENFQGKKRQVTVKTVGYTGWKLVAVVPEENILLDTYRIVIFTVALLCFFGCLMTFFNLRISAYISDPIRKLDSAVKKLEAGYTDVDIPEDGCYEVRHLSHSISSMVSTMRHLMLDIIQQEGEKRRTELEVLQSQINPHFLYNSLDSVIWMTESGRNSEAVQMVTSLARLFRISLSKGSSIIPLKDEIEHASHYMIIQKIRFKNKFETKFILNDVDDLYALKLCLQPILENAIYHGMAACDEDGIITVNAYRQSGNLIVDISDNGLGMTSETVDRLLDETKKSTGKGSGVGLRNVDHRIKLTFGKEYGLTIFSEPDMGTTVRVTMPILDKDEAKKWGEVN